MWPQAPWVKGSVSLQIWPTVGSSMNVSGVMCSLSVDSRALALTVRSDVLSFSGLCFLLHSAICCASTCIFICTACTYMYNSLSSCSRSLNSSSLPDIKGWSGSQQYLSRASSSLCRSSYDTFASALPFSIHLCCHLNVIIAMDHLPDDAHVSEPPFITPQIID